MTFFQERGEMSVIIKSISGTELFKSELSTIGKALQGAVSCGANLWGANLRGA